MTALTRRGFLELAGGLGLAGLLPRTEPDLWLRPPGAVRDFLSRCIRCGACLEACPYDCIRAFDVTAGALVHTPWVDPLATPCYLCQERGSDGADRPLGPTLRCGEVCPTGALAKIVNTKEVLASVPAELKMGTSLLERRLCLAWEYDSCGECYLNCPLKDAALRDSPPEGPEPGARGLRPWVDPEQCIGCGMCNYVCPVNEHVASASFKTDVKLSLFEERYASMVRNVMAKSGADAQLPAIRVRRRSG